jgi:hypothetical protein
LWRSFTSFVKFTPRYLIIFEAIVNRIISIHYFSVCSLLVYRKANDFSKLILYPATLLQLFMVSRSFRVEFFGFLRYRIVSSVNSDILTRLPGFLGYLLLSHILHF